MALDTTKTRWDWAPVTQGDTYPACQITESGSDSDLSRVRIKFKGPDGTTALVLDSSTSGITITTATAGAWDFQIDTISPATTAALDSGFYSYDMEFTTDAGTVSTLFCGVWQVIKQITD